MRSNKNVRPSAQDNDLLFSIVAGLVRGVLLAALGRDYPLNEPACTKAAHFMVEKVQGMPRFLGIPMAILTILFDLFGIVDGAKRFRSKDVSSQIRQVNTWKTSPLGPCRDLIYFYQKMSVFIYFSLLESKESY